MRKSPVLASLVGKLDPTGLDRKRDSDKGNALAGKNTLNRMELGPHKPVMPIKEKDSTRLSKTDKKVVCHPELIKYFFIQTFLDSYKKPPKEIILDFDATDDPLHGNQEGRFFHGYYRGYCYLPLYVFCGDHLLVANMSL